MNKDLQKINNARDFLAELYKHNETTDEVMASLYHGLLVSEAELAKREELTGAEWQMISDGDNIGAIKHFRLRTGYGLYASKMAIDSHH